MLGSKYYQSYFNLGCPHLHTEDPVKQRTNSELNPGLAKRDTEGKLSLSQPGLTFATAFLIILIFKCMFSYYTPGIKGDFSSCFRRHGAAVDSRLLLFGWHGEANGSSSSVWKRGYSTTGFPGVITGRRKKKHPTVRSLRYGEGCAFSSTPGSSRAVIIEM